jgi:hypothetical protein
MTSQLMSQAKEAEMLVFIDKPDDVETQLEDRIRKVWRRPRPAFEVTVREAADAVRWGHPR